MPLPGLRWRGPLVAGWGGPRRVLAPVVPAAGTGPDRRAAPDVLSGGVRVGVGRRLVRGLLATLLSVVVSYVAFFPHPDGLLLAVDR